MMIEFQCLKLEQNTIENYTQLPNVGDVMQTFKRWPTKKFTVASIDTTPSLYPLVMLREVEIRQNREVRLPADFLPEPFTA